MLSYILGTTKILSTCLAFCAALTAVMAHTLIPTGAARSCPYQSTLAELRHSNELLIQRCHTEVHKVPALTGWSLLSQAAFQVILSPIKECFAAAANITPQGLGRILGHDLLKKSMQGKACQCLVVSLILVNSLLGSMEAERSWILPTSGTAHKSAWHKDVSVSHFLQCYLRCDGIGKDPVLVQAVQGHIRNEDSRTVYVNCRENWLYNKI